MNGKLARAIIIALAVGFISSALVSWRAIGVLQNDMKHLESLMMETRQDVRDLRAYFEEQ